jgi:hypothetical protein
MFGLKSMEVRKLAYECAVKFIKVPDNWTETKCAGPDWLSGFLKRNKTAARKGAKQARSATSAKRGKK